MAGDVGRISQQAGPGAADLSEQPMSAHLACASHSETSGTSRQVRSVNLDAPAGSLPGDGYRVGRHSGGVQVPHDLIQRAMLGSGEVLGLQPGTHAGDLGRGSGKIPQSPPPGCLRGLAARARVAQQPADVLR